MTQTTQHTPSVKPLSNTCVPYATLQLVKPDEASELGMEVISVHHTGLVQVNFGGRTLGDLASMTSGLRWLEWLAFDGVIDEDALWAWFPGYDQPTRITDRDFDKQTRLWKAAKRANARFERSPQVMNLYGEFGDRVLKFASHPIIQARLAAMHEDAFTDELQGSDFSASPSLTSMQHSRAESQFLAGVAPGTNVSFASPTRTTPAIMKTCGGQAFVGRAAVIINHTDAGEPRMNRKPWADELTPLSPLFPPRPDRCPKCFKTHGPKACEPWQPKDELQAWRLAGDFLERLASIGNPHMVSQKVAGILYEREVGGLADLDDCIADLKLAYSTGKKWLDCIPDALRDALASEINLARQRLALPELDARSLLIGDLLDEEPDALACLPAKLASLVRKQGIDVPVRRKASALSFVYSTLVSSLTQALHSLGSVTLTPRDRGRGVRKASGRRYPSVGRSFTYRRVPEGVARPQEYQGRSAHCQRTRSGVLVTAS